MVKKEENHLRLVGERIMVLRKRKGLTQAKAGKAIKTTGVQIGRIERGESNYAIIHLLRLAELFGMSLSELVDIEESK